MPRRGIAPFCQKNPRVRKIICPQFWGRKWLRQFYGRLEKLRSFCRKTSMPIKFLGLGGGILDFGGEGVPILFLWARGFFWFFGGSANLPSKESRYGVSQGYYRNIVRYGATKSLNGLRFKVRSFWRGGVIASSTACFRLPIWACFAEFQRYLPQSSANRIATASVSCRVEKSRNPELGKNGKILFFAHLPPIFHISCLYFPYCLDFLFFRCSAAGRRGRKNTT